MRRTAAASLALAFCLWPATARPQESPIRNCGLYPADTGVTSGARIRLDAPPAPAGGPPSREGVTLVLTKGETPEVHLHCDFDSPAALARLGLKPGEVRTFDLSVEGGRNVKDGGLDRWVVPVRDGENTVTVRRRAVPAGRELARAISFRGFLYTLEPAGQIAIPLPESVAPRLHHYYLDASGLLYVVWEGFDKTRPPGKQHLRALVKYAPGGATALRYLFGRSDVLESGDEVRILAVDAGGGLWAVVNRNVVQFDRNGKFVKSVLAFGGSERITSAEQLQTHRWSQELRARQGELGRIQNVGSLAASVAQLGNTVFMIGIMDGGALGLVRVTLDGKATVVNLGLPSGRVGSLHAGPDGNLYLGAYVQDRQNGVKVYTPEGRSIREFVLPQGAAIGLKAVAGDGSLYTGRSCDTRVLKDLSGHSAGGLGEFRVRRVWKRDASARGGGTTTYEDRLTGATAATPIVGTNPGWWACWLDGAGAVHVLYEDLRIGKFTPASATGAVARAAPAASEAPSPKLTLRFGPYLDQTGLPEGIALDDQAGNTVGFGAELTDPQGKPLPGVEIELSVSDARFPKQGSFSVRSRTTDAQGRVAGTYKPPRLEEGQVRPGTYIGFQARALVQGMAPLEAQENVLALPLVEAYARISRAGYTPVERIPVRVPSARSGKVLGKVVHVPWIRHELSAPAGSVARNQKDQIPVNRAKVELFTRQGTLLGQAETDATGGFTLEFATDPKIAERPLGVLPEFLEFTRLDPEVGDLPADVRRTLRELANARYNYKVAALDTLLERFPHRLAAARDDLEVAKEVDRLFRVGMLCATIWKTHDLAAHAASQWAASLEALMEDLLNIFDPLKAVAPDFHVVDAAGRQAIRTMVRSTPVQWEFVQSLLAKLGAQWKRQAFRRATQKMYEATAWNYVKKQLQSALLAGGDAATNWKRHVVETMTGHYREQAQAELDQAARLWTDGTIPFGGRQGPVFRARYSEIAAFVDEARARQLDRDLGKADVKLFADTLVKGLAIYATGTGMAPAAEGLAALDRALKLLPVALDASQGNAWIDAYEAGLAGVRQFGQAALRSRAYCLGAAC